MLKRTYSETQTQFIQDSLSKKFKSNDELILNNICILLEKINSRLESCEKKITFLYNCQVKSEQDKIEQKIRETEIFNSYIS